MGTKIDIHPIQSGILLFLLFLPKARFSQLNQAKVPSDQFNFHLKTLINGNLVKKTDKGQYELTNNGKEFANRFDTEQKEIERQAKIGVLICSFRKINGVYEYLLQQRLKQPYYGFWGFISGKVKWGETVLETAEREFKEETGLNAEFKLNGVKHKIDYDKEGNLLEDKFFFVLRAENPRGKLKVNFLGGKNKWFKREAIYRIKGLFDDVNTTLEIAEDKVVSFREAKFKVKKY